MSVKKPHLPVAVSPVESLTNELMATVKIRRGGGLHCFHCNAAVPEEANRCQTCGREFSGFAVGNPAGRRRLGDRVRAMAARRRRGHRYPLVVLAVAVVLLLALLVRSWRHQVPVSPEPEGARPQFEVIEEWDSSSPTVTRRSVAVLVEAGSGRDALRTVLGWAAHDAAAGDPERSRRPARVVWVYALEDSVAPKHVWRAMAIWVDPTLPDPERPAGIGGDAVESGAFEYDFSNPTVLSKSEGG